ncbi:hypothetical protein NH340_JMT06975 [Sarcoptes scabiei]|nr:hypothetical protein NH340_JMT06975 [Sarcoptes scabiei]
MTSGEYSGQQSQSQQQQSISSDKVQVAIRVRPFSNRDYSPPKRLKSGVFFVRHRVEILDIIDSEVFRIRIDY